MGSFSISRWFVLAFVLQFATVVLGISAHLVAIRPNDYWPFAALAIAVSSLTILTLPFILILSIFSGTSFSWLIAEALWLSIMWILWLSTAANSTRAARRRYATGACSFSSEFSSQICSEFRVVEAFSYINFIILLFFTVATFAYAFSHADDDDDAWRGRGRGEAARQEGPETGQVKPAKETQGQQQQFTASSQSANVTHGGQPSKDSEGFAAPKFPEPEPYHAN